MDMLRLPIREVSAMGFLELAKARYSVRKFSSRPIEQEKLDRIIEAAMIAPTGKNNQAWRCYVLRSDEAMEKINGLSRCIFGAPMVLLFTYDTQEEWHSPLEEGIHSGVEDVSIVATHAMLEAWELGVGSIWVNLFPNTETAKAFGLPENEKAVLLLPIGYPGEKAAPSPMHSAFKPMEELAKFL